MYLIGLLVHQYPYCNIMHPTASAHCNQKIYLEFFFIYSNWPLYSHLGSQIYIDAGVV